MKPGTTVTSTEKPLPIPNPVPLVSKSVAPVKIVPQPSEALVKPKPIPDMSLSGKEADDLFNSLFPGLAGETDSGLSGPVAIADISSGSRTAAPVVSTTTEQVTAKSELPRRASNIFRPRNKNTLRLKLEWDRSNGRYGVWPLYL